MDGGAVSRIILVALGLFILGPIIRGLFGLIRSVFKQLRRCGSGSGSGSS